MSELKDRSRSVPHVSRIEASRHSSVGGPFNDGPSIWEQRDLEWIFGELEHKVVLADLTVRGESLAHLGQINRPRMLVNLHRVSSAKRNVWTPFAGQVNELLACRRSGTPDQVSMPPPQLVRCAIDRKKAGSAACCLSHLQGVSSLPSPPPTPQNSPQNSGFLRCRRCRPRRRALRKNAAQARSLSREHIHRDPIASDRRRIDPGQGVLHCVVVDQISSLEVVGAIENQLHSAKHCFGVIGPQVC